jgi:hypothetical protein
MQNPNAQQDSVLVDRVLAAIRVTVDATRSYQGGRSVRLGSIAAVPDRGAEAVSRHPGMATRAVSK